MFQIVAAVCHYDRVVQGDVARLVLDPAAAATGIVSDRAADHRQRSRIPDSAALPALGAVVGDRAVDHRHGAEEAVNPAAVAGRIGRHGAALEHHRPQAEQTAAFVGRRVVGKRRIAQRERAQVVNASSGAVRGRVAADAAAGDSQRAGVKDSPAPDRAIVRVGARAVGRIVRDRAAAERQRPTVEDPAAVFAGRIVGDGAAAEAQ